MQEMTLTHITDRKMTEDGHLQTIITATFLEYRDALSFWGGLTSDERKNKEMYSVNYVRLNEESEWTESTEHVF